MPSYWELAYGSRTEPGDFILVRTNPERRIRLHGLSPKEHDAMAGKTTREPINSTSEGPTPAGRKAGEKVETGNPATTKNAKAPTEQQQEQLDRAPVLDQREYIVDGNTAVPTRETEAGKPFDAEAYEKDRAESIGESGNTVPLSDTVVGLVEPGAGNPAAATHQSGALDVPKAEGDEDSIRAWNARKAAEAAFKKGTDA